ncbi:MAG TPA: hypothetical protein VMS21_03830, partial [Methylomirabilota bacterium]|nr:hypothetical protein [Methylomirabilota bacterium]
VQEEWEAAVLRCGEFRRPFFTSHLLPALFTPGPGEGKGKRSGVKDEAAGEVRSDPVPGSKAGRLERDQFLNMQIGSDRGRTTGSFLKPFGSEKSIPGKVP